MLAACGRLPEIVLKTIQIETWIDAKPYHISKKDKRQTIKGVQTVSTVHRVRGEDISNFATTALLLRLNQSVAHRPTHVQHFQRRPPLVFFAHARPFERMNELPHSCVALKNNYKVSTLYWVQQTIVV